MVHAWIAQSDAATSSGMPGWLLFIVGLVVGGVIGTLGFRVLLGVTLKSARSEAKNIVDTAEIKAKAEKQERELELEKEFRTRRDDLEKELDEGRKELREAERRLDKRENQFDKREASLEREQNKIDETRSKLEARDQELKATEDEIEKTLVEQREKLITIAGLSAEDAKAEVLQRIEEESRLDAAKIVRKVAEDTEAEAHEKATEILVHAVQRFSTEVTADSTVRSVAIPSDDMKGRIIGREGRNIRAIEKATGADIIVDDTPGVIVVSCFDKIRQAVAVQSLERLIKDGRMHPTRIEEVVQKVSDEIGQQVVKAGKDAAIEVNLRGLHPKVSEAMGKLHFRTSFGQNVLRHSIEVGYFSQIIADQLGLDGTIARRAGYLHDIGKAMDHEQEGGHPAIGMAFAKQHGEKEPILNVIGGHHADIPSTSFYTPIVMAADAISSARPGARRESMERYIQRLTELQDIALGEKGVNEAYAIQAGREVRVMVDAKKISDDEAHLVADRIAKRVSTEMTFPGEIRVTVLRETRAVEIAR
ncbi:MAG: ribonuclease Y [Phycisphaera sp.]|nr:MAG: ribonuclease Y [Phycisphaera sp.]